MTPHEIADTVRAIARSAEFNKCGDYCMINLSQRDIDSLNLAASHLRKIASGEYAPVVHAEWVKQNCQGDYGLCSVCDCRIPWVPKNYKYCPSCGALMTDESEKEFHHD